MALGKTYVTTYYDLGGVELMIHATVYAGDYLSDCEVDIDDVLLNNLDKFDIDGIYIELTTSAGNRIVPLLEVLIDEVIMELQNV